MSEPILNLSEKYQELLDKLDPGLRAVAIQYQPWLSQLTINEAVAWFHLAMVDYVAAYEQVLRTMDMPSIVDQWAERTRSMADLNIKASANAAVGREMMAAIAVALARIVCLMLGLPVLL